MNKQIVERLKKIDNYREKMRFILFNHEYDDISNKRLLILFFYSLIIFLFFAAIMLYVSMVG